MKKILSSLATFVVGGVLVMLALGAISHTKNVPIGNTIEQVTVSVGDTVPLTTGVEAEIVAFRENGKALFRFAGGGSVVLTLRYIAWRLLFSRRRRQEQEAEQ